MRGCKRYFLKGLVLCKHTCSRLRALHEQPPDLVAQTLCLAKLLYLYCNLHLFNVGKGDAFQGREKGEGRKKGKPLLIRSARGYLFFKPMHTQAAATLAQGADICACSLAGNIVLFIHCADGKQFSVLFTFMCQQIATSQATKSLENIGNGLRTANTGSLGEQQDGSASDVRRHLGGAAHELVQVTPDDG